MVGHHSNDIVHTGVPRFVAAVLRRGRPLGRSAARRAFAAGMELTRRAEEWTRAADAAARDRKLAGLAHALEQEDVGAILEWFDREFPACMGLVPAGERPNFAWGALNAYQHRDRQ